MLLSGLDQRVSDPQRSQAVFPGDAWRTPITDSADEIFKFQTKRLPFFDAFTDHPAFRYATQQLQAAKVVKYRSVFEKREILGDIIDLVHTTSAGNRQP